MKKYKAIVKYKIGMTDNMEFESSATTPKEVAAEIKDKINAELAGFSDNTFFSSDDVSVEYEIADITPAENDV